jgi:hypothetical protein
MLKIIRKNSCRIPNTIRIQYEKTDPDPQHWFVQVTTETEAIFMQIFPRQSAAFIVRILSP